MTTLGQFYRQKPANIVVYTALEFYHSDFGVLRYVVNQYDNVTLTLEAGAPRNAGEAVVFEPIAAQAGDPEQGDFGASIDIQLGAAGAQLKEKINGISEAGRREPIEVVWRKYRSDQTSAPGAVFYMQVANVAFNGRNVAIVAQQRSAQELSVWRVYKDDEFVGLKQGF